MRRLATLILLMASGPVLSGQLLVPPEYNRTKQQHNADEARYFANQQRVSRQLAAQELARKQT